jgi:hypothetical protein
LVLASLALISAILELIETPVALLDFAFFLTDFFGP